MQESQSFSFAGSPQPFQKPVFQAQMRRLLQFFRLCHGIPLQVVEESLYLLDRCTIIDKKFCHKISWRGNSEACLGAERHILLLPKNQSCIV